MRRSREGKAPAETSAATPAAGPADAATPQSAMPQSATPQSATSGPPGSAEGEAGAGRRGYRGRKRAGALLGFLFLPQVSGPLAREAALACRAAGAVLGELRGPQSRKEGRKEGREEARTEKAPAETPAAAHSAAPAGSGARRSDTTAVRRPTELRPASTVVRHPSLFSFPAIARPCIAVMAASGLALVLWFALAWAGAGPAGAQGRSVSWDAGLFERVDEGTREVLGFLWDYEAGRSSGLGEMLWIFNAGVLVLAVALLIWHTAAAAVETGQEGRVRVGLWEALRMVAALALIAPLPGGMSGGQHIVLGLGRLGGDFAAVVWEPFTAQVLEGGGPAVPGELGGGRERAMLSRVFLMELCREVANTHEAGRVYIEEERWWSRRLERGLGRRLGDGLGGEPAPGPGVRASFNGTSWLLPKELCGAIDYAPPPEGEGPGAAAVRAHFEALEGVRPRLAAIARQVAERHVPGAPGEGGEVPDIGAMLARAGVAEAWAAVVLAGIAAAENEEEVALRTALAEDAGRIGWLSAGSAFLTLSRRAGAFRSAALALPETVLPAPVLGEHLPVAHRAVSEAALRLDGSRGWSPHGAEAGLGGGAALAGVSGFLQWIDLDAVVVADSGKPVRDLIDFGHGLIAASLGAFTLIAGAAVAAGLAGGIPFVGEAASGAFSASWQVLDVFVSSLLALMLLGGAVLAWVLPSLPFVRFLFGVLAWILSVCVAVLAVTVWLAALVTRGEGDRLVTSGARAGLLFLPGLVLRPPLMLFGLVLGFFLFEELMGLFNAVWLVQLREQAAGDDVGLLAWVALTVIYVMVAYAAMNAAMKLIDLLPAAAQEWIGARAGAEGQEAERLGGSLAGAMGRLQSLRTGSPRLMGRARPGGP